MATNESSSCLEGAALPALCLETRLYATFDGASLYVLALAIPHLLEAMQT